MKRSDSIQHPVREKEGILLPYDGSVGAELGKKFLEMLLAKNRKQRERLMKSLAELDEEDAMILKLLHRKEVSNMEQTDITQPKKKVFRSAVKDSMMADALYEVYETLLSNNDKARKMNGGLTPIDLIAYLFIMVDVYHYGRDDFHENEFFIAKVRPELRDVRGITRKTMSNRINRELSCLYLSPEEKNGLPDGLKRQNKSIENIFNTICGIFHTTRLGKMLLAHA